MGRPIDRRVTLAEGVDVTVAIAEPERDTFALVVMGAATWIVLDIAPHPDGERWIVDERALLDAFEGAVRLVAIDLIMRHGRHLPAARLAPFPDDDRDTAGPRCNAHHPESWTSQCARPAVHVGEHRSHAGLTWG